MDWLLLTVPSDSHIGYYRVRVGVRTDKCGDHGQTRFECLDIDFESAGHA